MLDIRFIRENPELVKEKSEHKGYQVSVEKLLELDGQRLQKLQQVENLRQQRNSLAEKSKGSQPSSDTIEEGKRLKEELTAVEAELSGVASEFDSLHRLVPNVFPEDTPLGGEENNRQEKTWGDITDKDFKVVDHVAWAESRGLLDFERGAKVAGSKFYFTFGSLVELEIAVLQLGLQIVKKHGFLPTMVPHMVNSQTIDGAGFAARGSEEQQIYKIENQDLNLIATAEIPLTGYHTNEIIPESDLPKLYAGYSPAYRMEAGAYGKHSKGLYRVHQFNKLELYAFCLPEESEQWHQKLLAIEEELCQQLEIPYRVVRIAAGDLGAPAYKKYDIEYWSPVDQAYRELMSCSNVTDYQTRRLNIRFKNPKGEVSFLHSLNATAAAMSRIPIAIIENHQQSDGSVILPASLVNYMGGAEKL